MFAILHVAIGLFAIIEWILLAGFIGGIRCLRLTHLDVPSTVRQGQGVRLNCVYELEGDVLYSVKWYRDNMEFYRFVPIDRPNGQFFALQGIQVDASRSGNGTVYLRSVTPQTSGVFRCEVSADAPSFQTVAAEKAMFVEDENDISEEVTGEGGKQTEELETK